MMMMITFKSLKIHFPRPGYVVKFVYEGYRVEQKRICGWSALEKKAILLLLKSFSCVLWRLNVQKIKELLTYLLTHSLTYFLTYLLTGLLTYLLNCATHKSSQPVKYAA